MSDNNISNSINRIRKKFLDTLREWLPVFEDFMSALRNGRVDTKKIDNIRIQLHKIAGSAETFGFPGLGKRSIDLEHILDRLSERGDFNKIPTGFINEFEVLLGEINVILKSEENIYNDNQKLPEGQEEQMGYYNFNLLVADDDNLTSELLKDGLKEEKCKITQALNGKEVFEILNNLKPEKPDLIVLDVNMPEMDGFQVLEALKNSPETKSIPVIMLTGKGEDENVIKGISSGAIDYITKPFQGAELVKRIIDTVKRYKTRILVADDDELIRSLLSNRFCSMGYMVLIAENGKDALEMIRIDKPDLAILDIMMPGMDGMAVLNKIKKDPATSDMPVIFLTAKRQQENILRGLETGANDYITKPFDVDEVSARVSGIFRRRKIL